jgi:Protein kinase domain/Bacterial Ig-like domain (group 2)
MADTPSPGPDSGGAPDPGSLVGTVLAGRYRLVQLLGSGAMGAVYVGEHLKIGRRDAIKVLRTSLARDTEAVARFTRGARNASQIHHPNVCTVYDFSDTSDGLQFLAMELVEGQSLTDLLQREGPLSAERAARIILQAAAALEAAHDLGIVHRDLKPDNIMIARAQDGRDLVKVVDFDIAKGSAEGEEKGVTRLGFVVGTPEYMSPEQLTGDPLDGRSDIYSLALVFFRMIAGELPYRSRSTQELMMDRLTRDPLTLRDVAPAIPFSAGLQAVLDHALARMRDQRPATAREFARELSDAVFGAPARPGDSSSVATAETQRIAPVQVPATVVAPRGQTTAPPSATERKPVPRRRAVGIGIGALVLVGAGGLVAKALLGGDGGPDRLVMPPTLALAVGDSARVGARVLGRDGAELQGAEIHWSSLSPDVATVDAAGTVHGLSQGTASVRAAAGSVEGTTEVTVSASVAAAPRLGVNALAFVVPADGSRPGARAVEVSGTGGPGQALVANVAYPPGSPTGWLSAHLDATTPPTIVVVQTANVPTAPGSYEAAVVVAWDVGGPADSLRVTLDVEGGKRTNPNPRPATRAWRTAAGADSLAWRQLFLLDDDKSERARRAIKDTTVMLWDAADLPDSIRARAAFAHAQAAVELRERDEGLDWARRAVRLAPADHSYRDFLAKLGGGDRP